MLGYGTEICSSSLDAIGCLDSGHTLIAGYAHVITLRRLPNEMARKALKTAGGSSVFEGIRSWSENQLGSNKESEVEVVGRAMDGGEKWWLTEAGLKYWADNW